MNDMSAVIEPKSDQLNADDLIAGPMTVTIREVKIRGGEDQPVSIFVDGTDKAYRPCKSMSRVLVHAWGADAKAYVGRSLTLYRDPAVKWGGMEVGGIRISHMSDIASEKLMMLTATRGSRKPHKVLPLVGGAANATAEDHSATLARLEEIAGPGKMPDLEAAWKDIGAPARKALADELPRLKELCAPTAEPETDAFGLEPVDTAPAGTAAALAIVDEINDAISTMDITTITTREAANIEAMPDELRIKIEVAADQRRNAIEAGRKEKAKEQA